MSEGEERDKATLRYFIRRHGDFSLMTVMTDNVVGFDNTNPQVGRFFLAQILPGEQFRYTFLYPGPLSEVPEDMENKIVVERENKVRKITGILIRKEFLYDKSEITLSIPETRYTVYTIVEQMPKYKGGMSQLMADFFRQFSYLPENKEEAQTTLDIEFIVTKTGRITDVGIAGKTPDTYTAFEEQGLAVFRKLQNWEPGRHLSSPVNVQMRIPFHIDRR